MTITDYKPEPIEIIVEKGSNGGITNLQQNTFSLINWNIGYAGLGAGNGLFLRWWRGSSPH